MRYVIFLTVLFTASMACAECQIIDHGDRTEVICEGPQPSAAEIRQRQEERKAPEVSYEQQELDRRRMDLARIKLEKDIEEAERNAKYWRHQEKANWKNK
jgi:hypothetical protein